MLPDHKLLSDRLSLHNELNILTHLMGSQQQNKCVVVISTFDQNVVAHLSFNILTISHIFQMLDIRSNECMKCIFKTRSY